MFLLPYEEILLAVLVFVRIGAVMFALPVFGEQAVPVRVRIILSCGLTIGIFPLVPTHWMGKVPEDVIPFGLLVFKEAAIGLTIGFIAKLVFEAMVMAASIVGFQMGFGTASLMMPDAEPGTNSFTALHRILIVLIFLSLDLHQLFFTAMAESFQLIPATGSFPTGPIGAVVVNIMAGLFLVSLQLAAPVMVALMFTMAALGLLSKAVPQINIFTMSFPISFFIGLIVYIASLSFYPAWIKNHLEEGQEKLYASIRLLGHHR